MHGNITYIFRFFFLKKLYMADIKKKREYYSKILYYMNKFLLREYICSTQYF
jgi:hypothetical protein